MSRRPTTNRPHHPRPKAGAISVTLALATLEAIERAALGQGLSVASYISELADVHAAELRQRERT